MNIILNKTDMWNFIDAIYNQTCNFFLFYVISYFKMKIKGRIYLLSKHIGWWVTNVGCCKLIALL